MRRHAVQTATLLLILAFCFSGTLWAQSKADDRAAAAPAGGTVTLEELIETAAMHNPEIQAAKLSASAAKSMILPASTLPDPAFTFQTMGDLIPPELMAGDPSSARTYGLEQEIPFPGKLDLKGKIASSEADIQELRHSLTHLQVVSEIKEAYYDLFFVQKSGEIVQKDKALLQNFIQIAETRYKVGMGIQQDVVKAHVELSKLIDRLLKIKQMRRIAESRINSLLYRPVETPVGKAAEYKKAELKYPLDALLSMAEKNSPSLISQDKEVERAQFSKELAKKGYYPDFAVGFTYFERRDIPEMYGVMVKASIPFYFWRKQTPELDAAMANLGSARKMRNDTTSKVNSQIRELFDTASISDQQARLYDSTIVPQARLSLESAVAGYQTGKVDFLTLVDNLVTLLEYELRRYESVSEFQKALARMEPLVGTELTR